MYALAYFFQENTYEVIPAEWIDDFDDNVEVDEDHEYIVNWRKGKSGKMTKYPAKILALNEDRQRIVELANKGTSGEERGRGKREKKKNPAYSCLNEAEESAKNEIPVPKKKKKCLSELKVQESLLEKISVIPDTDSDSEIEQTLSKNELQHHYDMANYKIKELKRENARLRQSLSLFAELPGLLSDVRELKAVKPGHTVASIQITEKNGTPTKSQPEHQAPAPGDMVKLAEGVSLKKSVLARLSKNPQKKVTELMTILFTREVMASSSLSGKKTNAWKEVDAKKQLDSNIVSAIAKYVQEQHVDFTFKDVMMVMRTKLNNEAKNVKHL